MPYWKRHVAEQNSLAVACRSVLTTENPREKAAIARRVAEDWRHGRLSRDNAKPTAWPDRPARPPKPELLPPRDMPRRKMSGENGRKAQLHALAHIELNAIDLAFDLIGRFVDAPLENAFIDDWMRVGADEARHFLMLADRLAELDMHYGDLPAHDGLWQAAFDTRHNLLARLSIVPLVLEARGLDVTPTMMEKFERAGDAKSAKMLSIIFEDEKTHVFAGSKWFLRLCNDDGLDPAEFFRKQLKNHFGGALKPPFNIEARDEAGLPRKFYVDAV